MKKVLILTASTGEGHNQAANSIIETLSKQNINCTKLEFLKSRSNFLNKIVVKGYEILASFFPNFYGKFYEFTDSPKTNNVLKVIFKITSLRLKSQINSYKPDLIIGTHPITINIISMLKNKGLDIPFISIVTDFKAHYTYIDKNVDAFITGSEYTKNSLVKRGINPDIIYPIGIPIRESFFKKDPDILKIKDKDYLSILLMGGSMGLSKISFVLDELLKNKNKIRITVVCGNNTKLEQMLISKCSTASYINKKIHILGYTTDIAYLMEYSDIIITKPGGLTISEAIIKNIPIIIPFVIPGQEMENTDFLVANGLAYYIEDLNTLNDVIDTVVHDNTILYDMKDKLKNLSNAYSSEKLVSIVKDIMKSNER